MEENSFVPSPINFNCWKHHASYIKKEISAVNSSKDIKGLSNHLLKIGESQMDLYFGELTPSKISRQILAYLKKEKSFSFDKYVDLIKSDGNDYKLAHLSDRSIWTLRLSENQERFVHIHPGRYSPHTIRVKAATLKTAILVLCFQRIGEIKIIETESVNWIRKKYLNEPLIKSLSGASGLGRTINVLSEKL